MRSAFVFLALILQFNLCPAQVSIEQIKLDTGNYQVGFKHYTVFDSSRMYNRIYDWTNSYTYRPIPISIWFPSDDSVSVNEPLTVLDYMRILKEEEEWENLPDEMILNWFYYPNTLSNQNHLKESTVAFYNLEPSTKKFPVVIYAPSYQASSIENFLLCEYLASHGYVVISSPSRGHENRYFEGGTGKDMEAQARDIEFLIKESNRLQYGDPDKIASMGFSFGGLSQVLSQNRDRRIKALVSLDGSIKYQYGTLKNSPFHTMEKVNVPFIHFSQKEIPSQVLKEDNIDSTLNTAFEFFDSLRYSDAYHFQMHDLTHSYFSTLGVLFQPRDDRQDKSDTEIMESYRWVSVYTLNFLNAYLKKDTDAMDFLNHEPEDNTHVKGLISKTIKRATKQVITFQDFNNVAIQQNYDHLDQLYDSLTALYPEFTIPEGELNNLGLQLVFHPEKTQMGIHVFLFATTLYPESANLWDSLAEGYLFAGDKKKAIRSFEKSLQLYPENQNAISRLKELE